MVLHIVSFNVNGLDHPARRSSLWREALKLKGDAFRKPTSNIFKVSTPTKKNRVLIAIDNSVAFNLQELHVDSESKYLIIILN